MKIKKIKTLAIANRGEVAVRIIKACQEMGIKTVLLHSEPDRNSRAYRMADQTFCIGPAATAESYLNIQANINGALAGGADAIHPGFGFLSENADFAQACAAADLIFVGPSPESIRELGDKINCKALARKAGLPLVPGYQGEDQSLKSLVNEVAKIGLPVIVKAAAGGGGRGMKLIREMNEAEELIQSAQREAQSAFGSPVVFLEKYLDRAKHIEFQIFGDSTGHVQHFFERECSVQRRHQKIIEEATAASISEDLRRQMGESAVALATLAKYKGAGTVEFLVQDNQFYLLEVNTRLQVEHPVTEMVMGIDLVKMQILTAQGDYVHSQTLRVPKGHSIECRVYAENPYLGGVPSTGVLGTQHWPEGPGRRYEFGFAEGDEITSHYDPMIAKVIVWDETRTRAIEKMIYVLKNSVVFGVHTNIPYLIKILSHPEFVSATMTTRFIETHFANPIEKGSDEALLKENKEAIINTLMRSKNASHLGLGGVENSSTSPFQQFWRGV